MAKESRKKPVPNRKKMARVERERLTNRIITISAIVMIAAIVLIIGGGAIYEYAIKPGQPAAVVNGTKISTTDFQKRVRYERVNLINNFYQNYQMLEIFASSPEYFAQIQSGLQQIVVQLEGSSMGQDVIDSMIDGVLIHEEAQRRGISVSADEIEAEVQSVFGYFPDGEPVPTDAPTQFPTSTLSTTQLALVTLTSTSTPFPTATDFPTATLDPDIEATSAPTASPIPSATSTATPYTFEAYQQQVDDYLAFLADDMDTHMSLDDFRAIAETSLYQQKLLQDIKENDVDQEEERVWARHILVETEEEAQEVLERLENGEDWAELAAEVSLDTGNKDRGGDLEWFNREVMVAEFSNAAFDAEVGEIVGPVGTSFGYHIIQVLGHEFQPRTPSEISQLAMVTLQTILEELRNDGEVEIKDDLLERTPTEPSIPDEVIQQVMQAQPATIPTPAIAPEGETP